MNPDQVQRFQPDSHRSASQSLRCLQARQRPLPQILPQCPTWYCRDNPVKPGFMTEVRGRTDLYF
jgi:hypothetical protein